MCKQRTQTVCPCLLSFVPHCTHDSVHGRRRQAPQPPRADSQDLSPLPPQSHPLTPPNYTPAATACPRSQVTTAATAPPPPMRKEKRRRRHRPHLTPPIKACRHHSRRCSHSGRRPHPMRIVAKTTSVLLPDPHKTPPSPPPPPTLRWAHTRRSLCSTESVPHGATVHEGGGGGYIRKVYRRRGTYIHARSRSAKGGGGGERAHDPKVRHDDTLTSHPCQVTAVVHRHPKSTTHRHGRHPVRYAHACTTRHTLTHRPRPRPWSLSKQRPQQLRHRLDYDGVTTARSPVTAVLIVFALPAAGRGGVGRWCGGEAYVRARAGGLCCWSGHPPLAVYAPGSRWLRQRHMHGQCAYRPSPPVPCCAYVCTVWMWRGPLRATMSEGRGHPRAGTAPSDADEG